jgi:hypothetical protein
MNTWDVLDTSHSERRCSSAQQTQLEVVVKLLEFLRRILEYSYSSVLNFSWLYLEAKAGIFRKFVMTTCKSD